MDKYTDDWFSKLLTAITALLLVAGTAFVILVLVWFSTLIISDVLSMGC